MIHIRQNTVTYSNVLIRCWLLVFGLQLDAGSRGLGQYISKGKQIEILKGGALDIHTDEQRGGGDTERGGLHEEGHREMGTT